MFDVVAPDTAARCAITQHRADQSVLSGVVIITMNSDATMSDEEKYFRWAYRLMIALAKRCKEDPDSVHNGQDWNGLVGTSYSMYFSQARREAGIDQDEFLEVVRSKIDVTDIYEEHCEK